VFEKAKVLRSASNNFTFSQIIGMFVILTIKNLGQVGLSRGLIVPRTIIQNIIKIFLIGSFA